LKAQLDGRMMSGKLLVINKSRGQIIMKSVISKESITVLDKSVAAVTLVYSHKYYTTAEAAASEGDTNVTAKLRMWWPDSSTTGVPAGTALTAYAGGTVTDGTLIQNKDIAAGLDISASNVTIRKCKIHLASGYFGVLFRSGTGQLVEDCEIYSTNDSGLYTAIAGSNMAVRRCHIHGWENGLSVGSNVVVEDCYIHDPCTYANAHVDGMEWGGSGDSSLVRHNHIIIRDETGCVNITPWGGGTAYNNAVRNNLFSGGTYSLYMRGDGGGTVSGETIIGNVWVKGSYVYGTHSVVFVSNITWKYNCLSDGTPVPLQ
jgi:Right handed beta helix region